MVFSDSQLPYKPGMNDPSPPPVYQEKKTSPFGLQPSAPAFRGVTKKYNQSDLDDLPSVPDNVPTGDNNVQSDSEDVTFDDLQKRFNNLKNN